MLSSNTLEVDVSWDFYDNQGLSGWGNSTSTEMNMEVKAEYGELKCIIKGLSPKLESPSLFLSISTRHYAIIRAKYKGSSQNARLLLRSGGTLSPNEQLLVSKSYWEQRQSIVIVSASPSATQPHNLSYDKPYNQSFLPSNLVDGQPETYYLSNNSAGVSIVIDLGTYRWINGFRVLPYGDNSSPKRCLLQYSITTGLGPYQTALSFTVQKNQDIIGNTIQQGFHEQRFTGFNGNARYWRFVVIDNHNGKGVGIREIALDGYDERVTVVPFSLDNSGEYQNYYLPIHTYLQGMLLRMRLEIMHIDNIEINPHKYGPLFQESLVIDHIRIIRAPEVWKVRGCLDKYFESASYQNPQYNISSHVDVINNHLPLYSFTENNLTLKYATTYDCPLKGGIPITIEGINFGFHPNVYIGNKSCQVLSNQVSSIDGRIQQLICTLPSSEVRTGYQRVRVENGVHPGLFHDLPSSLSYRVAPPVPTRPMITNICANKVDLVWNVPGNEFDQMTVTGYKIIWFQPKFRVFVNNITVGNITTTSIRGLTPATEYVFAIAAVSEGVEYTNLPTDLYGRRDLVSDAFIGEFSIFTNITATLLFDFDFNFFNGNSTLNHSSATVGNSLGPTGQYGAEGQYGLVLVGSANVQNCNVSSTCCDGYNSTIGPASCGTTKSVCAVLPARQLAYDLVIDGITRSGVISNLDYSNGQPAALSIFTLEELKANKGAALPSVACGPALRLTPSLGRSSGASWYRRKVNVREGFDTYIKFQISNPSQKCLVMDDVNTYCRSRGADGLAFVIQNVAPDALGSAGSGIGYEGIFNSLAVEIDTFFNYENMDFYENHISVMTQVYYCIYMNLIILHFVYIK